MWKTCFLLNMLCEIRKTITFSRRLNIQLSRIDHHLCFVWRSFSANGIFDVHTQRHVRTYRVYTHMWAIHRLLRPGFDLVLCPRTVMTAMLTGPCPLSILSGNSLSSKRERNLRWISIGSRRASPIAKRPCSIATATGYCGPTIVYAARPLHVGF